jgi:GNAT superfamily N-acetyltransferase
MTLRIERITSVYEALPAQLNPLLDEGDAWDAEQGQRYLASPDNALFLAFIDAVAVGFATAHRLQRFDRRKAEVLLYEIGVDEAWQRRGAARALIQAVLDWGRQTGADTLWVLTEDDNAAAMALYAATGGTADPPGTTLFAYPLAQGDGGEGA